ncbi:hypothetical protein [Nocardia sp. NPDC006630]|uniref:hypothetical protein n=1 Tax=Nocardia sp. NPDC006630 TaxID=3157181 RepID=UPI0033A12E5C
MAAVAGIGAFMLIGPSSSPADQQARDEVEIETVLRSVLGADHPSKVINLYSAAVRERFRNAQLPATIDRSDAGEVLYVSNFLIDGNVANADVTRTYPDLTELTDTFVLVREEGKWRVAE